MKSSPSRLACGQSPGHAWAIITTHGLSNRLGNLAPIYCSSSIFSVSLVPVFRFFSSLCQQMNQIPATKSQIFTLTLASSPKPQISSRLFFLRSQICVSTCLQARSEFINLPSPALWDVSSSWLSSQVFIEPPLKTDYNLCRESSSAC